jgi:hypothetical protein
MHVAESETAWYALTVNCQGLHHELRERVRLCPGTHINRLSSHQAFRDPADKASAIYWTIRRLALPP